MKLQKIISIIFFILLCRTAFSADENFHVITNKELPNKLGTFREIQFNTSDNQNETLYAALLNQQYNASLHLHESKIQILADYLDELSRHNDFIIGINGGFYQPNFTPAGLFIYKGKKIKRLAHSSLFNACVVINKNNKILLKTLNQCTETDNVMQTGPLLLKNGKADTTNIQRLKAKSKLDDFFNPHKRTMLALTNDNQLLIITTTQISLIDAANFLQQHPEAFGATKIKMAVNLDGGSSTGMYVRFPNEPFYFHELKHVKTFIFIN